MHRAATQTAQPRTLRSHVLAHTRPSRVFAKRTTVVATASKVADPKQAVHAKDFFDRTMEYSILRDDLLQKPLAMFVLDGPLNCGKSAFLHEIVTRETPGTKQTFLVVDMLSIGTSTPDAFAARLAGQLMANPDYVEWQPGSIGLTKPEDPETLTFKDLLPLLGAWLEDNKLKGTAAPVIIIDQADFLYDWKDKSALKALVAFFIWATKQKNLCHVVLATTDNFLVSWLKTLGLRDGHYKAYSLGDLPKEEAKAFVSGDGADWPGLLKEHDASFTLPESVWPDLYAVAGGNMQALQLRCLDASKEFSLNKGDIKDAWKEAFQFPRMEAELFVAKGFKPGTLPSVNGERPLWTPQQWGSVLDAIAKAEHNAVPVSDVEALLVGGNIKAGSVLLSLLKFNMVGYRRPSHLALDLPGSVYSKNGGSRPVITAISAAVLEYIKGNEWRSVYKWQSSSSVPRLRPSIWPWSGSS